MALCFITRTMICVSFISLVHLAQQSGASESLDQCTDDDATALLASHHNLHFRNLKAWVGGMWNKASETVTGKVQQLKADTKVSEAQKKLQASLTVEKAESNLDKIIAALETPEINEQIMRKTKEGGGVAAIVPVVEGLLKPVLEEFGFAKEDLDEVVRVLDEPETEEKLKKVADRGLFAIIPMVQQRLKPVLDKHGVSLMQLMPGLLRVQSVASKDENIRKKVDKVVKKLDTYGISMFGQVAF